MGRLVSCLHVLAIAAAAVMKDIDAHDLEFWMSELPPRLRNESIIYLAIPGSHDSMTYGINRSSELAPDAPPGLARLYPVFRGTIVRWSRTQSADVTRQLQIGIRYLDLRVATKKGTEQLFFTHGLYAEEISRPLLDIRDFLNSHPLEVVILDFQHFYGLSRADHNRLISFLVNLFGDKICPHRSDLESITLNTMYRYNKQVIVVYRNEAVYASARLWRPEQMPTPWPQKDSVRGLLRYLEALKRHPGTGFVHQAVLTPTTAFIVLRWVSNLRDQCAVPVREKVFPLLDTLAPGRPPEPAALRCCDRTSPAPINVVIADFVEMNDSQFSRMIVSLNYKLIGSRFYETIHRTS